MNKGKDLKPHIGIFGRRNNGKSSLINALTGQEVAIVSEIAGTTTDPVKRSYEIFGIGPAVIIDTAGIDDVGELGKKRVQKSLETLKQIDVAILVLANNQFGQPEKEMLEQFKKFELPYIIVHNKSDVEKLSDATIQEIKALSKDCSIIEISVKDNTGIEAITEALKQKLPETAYRNFGLLDGLVNAGDIVLLVTPIDSEAPEGRMILPQVMAWRSVLDNDAICMSVKETQLSDFFRLGIKPSLVVTDSQAFGLVSKIVPQDVPLTGFSILFARQKGDFEKYLEGTPAISNLKDGDRILIMESCSHKVNCTDIGRYKIPNWLKKFTGKELEFDVVAGFDFPDLEKKSYALVVQCGGCMFTRRQILNRLKPFIEKGIPVTNYGMLIAYVEGIFERATAMFR